MDRAKVKITPMTDPLASRFRERAGEPGAPEGATGAPTVIEDLTIRIDREGQWFYHGSPIHRKELVKLFASVLRRDEAGGYWLETPAEKGRIQVEDAPFMGVELIRDGDGRGQCLRLRTNVDEIVIIGKAHRLRIDIHPETGEPGPYVEVRDGLEARLTRSTFYELVDLGVEEGHDKEQIFGIWSQGTFFPIGNPKAD